MSKSFIITLVVILVLVFVPIIPFKSLDRIQGGNGGAEGEVMCYTKFYSVLGLINLYGEKEGMIYDMDAYTKHVTWHFLSCYGSENAYR